MLTAVELKVLLERSESSILDFKKTMYDFTDDANDKTTANYVKDIISFCNTVRNETSYIIVGVEEKEDKSKVLHGLDKDMDDAILQQKVMNKVSPKPNFQYYTVALNDKKFGVFDFPRTKYPTPLYSTVKLKGLDVEKMYFRQGTSNTEASALEVIKISQWLNSLPDFNHYKSVDEEINLLIQALTNEVKPLSALIGDMVAVAEKYKLSDILSFGKRELQGFTRENVNGDDDSVRYRVQSVFMTFYEIQISTYLTSQQVKQSFERQKEFFEMPMLFSYSIVKLEKMHSDIVNRTDGVGTIKINSKDILRENDLQSTVTLFYFKDTITNIYTNIRQKAIDLLVQMKK